MVEGWRKAIGSAIRAEMDITHDEIIEVIDQCLSSITGMQMDRMLSPNAHFPSSSSSWLRGQELYRPKLHLHRCLFQYHYFPPLRHPTNKLMEVPKCCQELEDMLEEWAEVGIDRFSRASGCDLEIVRLMSCLVVYVGSVYHVHNLTILYRRDFAV